MPLILQIRITLCLSSPSSFPTHYSENVTFWHPGNLQTCLKDYRFHVKIQPNHFEWSLWITSNADTGIQSHNYRKDALIKPLHFCPPFNSRRWTLHILPEFTAHLTQRPPYCWADLNDQHLACSQGDYNQKLLAKWARTSQILWMLTQYTHAPKLFANWGGLYGTTTEWRLLKIHMAGLSMQVDRTSTQSKNLWQNYQVDLTHQNNTR